MIHKTAIVDSKAKIFSNVKIGPYSVVGPNVEINQNSEVLSHVSIVGNTKIGKNNKIYPFSSIGNDPQDLNNLSNYVKKSDLVLEIVNFLEKDKKRPICTPFSK